MVFEREMGRIKIQRPSQGDPLLVKGISYSPNGGLRALVMDVPGFKMLQRPGIHQYQRWMDDRSCVHQRAAEYVFAWLNGVGLLDDGDRPISLRAWPNAGW